MVNDQKTPRGLAFGLANYVVLAAGVAAIAFGYVLLDNGSITAAPLLLVLGYGILLPAGILVGWRALGPKRDGPGKGPNG
ncbi:MAG: hypothetical protein ACC682_03525 [Gemmatimonadota bacterium]